LLNQPSDRVDRETIELAKAGDDVSLSKIVKTYQAYLLFIANRQLEPALARRASASDVVQDTVAHLKQKIGSFEGQSEPELKAWLRVSLCNTLKNTRRFHNQEKRSITKETKALSSEFKDAATPSKEIQARETLAQIEHGLATLSNKDQNVLRLRHQEGLTFTEIGKALGTSADAARMSWGRAVERLKKKIQEAGEV
jgi:RNA polymerase sigma-70 factor (ECF subfamily)